MDLVSSDDEKENIHLKQNRTKNRWKLWLHI